MKWLKKVWRKKTADISLVTPAEVLPGAEFSVTDKSLDAILEVAGVTRRELYDLWQDKNKVDTFPNDPKDVLAFAKKHGVL